MREERRNKHCSTNKLIKVLLAICPKSKVVNPKTLISTITFRGLLLHCRWRKLLTDTTQNWKSWKSKRY